MDGPRPYRNGESTSASVGYHQRTYELLGLEPKHTSAEDDVLAMLGTSGPGNIRIPRAVREWYSAVDGAGLLQTYSNEDSAVPARDFAPSECAWRGGDRGKPVPVTVVEFLVENQAVCIWGILLDGSEDPPVVVRPNEEGEGWIRCADSFSTFVFTRCWDFQPWKHGWLMMEAQDDVLSDRDLSFLRTKFREGPTTYAAQSFENAVSYRFEAPHGRLLVTSWDQADWYLHAKTATDLRALAESVWRCATLSKSLYGLDEEARRVLVDLRDNTGD